ncbi:hypothetical protein, partial [Mesorhizobium delmotii]|uniref:hypothetical protein n=1 Tax=Mesorhizobium delmotii TaxID=1631247 RepID=UPI001AD83E23
MLKKPLTEALEHLARMPFRKETYCESRFREMSAKGNGILLATFALGCAGPFQQNPPLPYVSFRLGVQFWAVNDR